MSCRCCAARLVGAGVLDPQAENVSPYAADHGTRDLDSELAAIAARSRKVRASK